MKISQNKKNKKPYIEKFSQSKGQKTPHNTLENISQPIISQLSTQISHISTIISLNSIHVFHALFTTNVFSTKYCFF